MLSRMSGPSRRVYFSDLCIDTLTKGETFCKNPVNLSKPHKHKILTFYCMKVSFDCQLSGFVPGLVFINDNILFLVYHRYKKPWTWWLWRILKWFSNLILRNLVSQLLGSEGLWLFLEGRRLYIHEILGQAIRRDLFFWDFVWLQVCG